MKLPKQEQHTDDRRNSGATEAQGGGKVAADKPKGTASPVQFPSLELLKGGGAIQGIGEKFQANPVTGTGSMSVPITMSPGRGGFAPQLALSYDSGADNATSENVAANPITAAPHTSKGATLTDISGSSTGADEEFSTDALCEFLALLQSVLDAVDEVRIHPQLAKSFHLDGIQKNSWLLFLELNRPDDSPQPRLACLNSVTVNYSSPIDTRSDRLLQQIRQIVLNHLGDPKTRPALHLPTAGDEPYAMVSYDEGAHPHYLIQVHIKTTTQTF